MLIKLFFKIKYLVVIFFFFIIKSDYCELKWVIKIYIYDIVDNVIY